jgi:hypothetical protein
LKSDISEGLTVVVAKGRERLAESKRAAQMDMEIFNLKTSNYGEVREHYQLTIT